MQNDVTRNHKDSLFQLAFRDNKEAALSLYNAVNGSHHTDASKLKFELLDRGIFMRMENDNGFILDQVLGQYEHQSTLNPNMPLRGFLYCADIYKGMIDRHRLLYGSKLIKIPLPQYIVFYNGVQDMGGERKLLRLSDAFEKEDPNYGYEWTAEMININYGHNEELLNSCKLLKDYSYFVQKVRDYACDMERHDAIMKVMDECIKADIFKEVLQKYREEILRMSFWEFDEEEYKEYLISEERENTERERKRADEAEARADEAESRADEAEARANNAESRADNAEEKAACQLIVSMHNRQYEKEAIEEDVIRAFPNLKDTFERVYAEAIGIFNNH